VLKSSSVSELWQGLACRVFYEWAVSRVTKWCTTLSEWVVVYTFVSCFHRLTCHAFPAVWAVWCAPLIGVHIWVSEWAVVYTSVSCWGHIWCWCVYNLTPRGYIKQTGLMSSEILMHFCRMLPYYIKVIVPVYVEKGSYIVCHGEVSIIQSFSVVVFCFTFVSQQGSIC
jgi:hypothetical protein